jgi:hypothetical protein
MFKDSRKDIKKRFVLTSFLKTNKITSQVNRIFQIIFYVIAAFFSPAYSIVFNGSVKAFGGKPNTS